jgi:hypothetical protein
MILVISALACAVGGEGDGGSAQATADALSQSISLTATANTGGEPSGDALATAQAAATQQAIAAQATADAIANLNAEQIAATRAAFSQFINELPKYGVDPNEGRPAWIHPPVALDIEGYLQFDYANLFIGTVVTDFVMSSDITWNTQYGTSGCGFALRNNGNEEAMDTYLAIATRGGSGRVEFAIMTGGEIANVKDFYAYGLDDNFDWRNDTTNRLTIVMRGPRVWLYTNDTLIADFDVNDPPKQPYIPPAPAKPADYDTNPDAAAAYDAAKAEYNQIVGEINAQFKQSQETYREAGVDFPKGFVAMVVLSESGRTHCQFDNTWLFLIEN